MLIELMVLSIVYLYAFGFVKIKPATAPTFDAAKGGNAVGADAASCMGFYCATWKLYDLLGTHWLPAEATTPLSKADAV